MKPSGFFAKPFDIIKATTEANQAQALREAMATRAAPTCDWCGAPHRLDAVKCPRCTRTLAGDPNHADNNDQAIEGLWAEIKRDAVELFADDPYIALEEGDETNFQPRCTIYVADHEFEAGGDTLHHALEMAHSEMMFEAHRQGKGE